MPQRPPRLKKAQNYPVLEDVKWFVKVMPLMDITGHLNEVYLQLKGAGQTVSAFLGKLAVFQAAVLPLLSATLDT